MTDAPTGIDGLVERMSALFAWCASWGVDIEILGETVKSVRMGEAEREPPGKPLRPLRQRLRRALDLWTEASHEAATLRQADVRYQLGGDRRRAEFWQLIRYLSVPFSQTDGVEDNSNIAPDPLSGMNA